MGVVKSNVFLSLREKREGGAGLEGSLLVLEALRREGVRDWSVSSWRSESMVEGGVAVGAHVLENKVPSSCNFGMSRLTQRSGLTG